MPEREQEDELKRLRDANLELRSSLEQLHAIGTLAARLGAANEPTQVLDATLAIIPATIAARAVVASLFVSEDKRLEATHRFNAGYVIPPLPDGTLEWVLERAQMTAVPLDTANGAVVIPLVFQGERMGWLSIFVDDGLESFNESTSLSLTIMAGNVASALRNCRIQILQKMEADRLARTLNFVEGTLAAVNQGVFRISDDGKVTLANKNGEKLLGVPVSREHPPHYSKIFPQELARATSAHFMTSRRGRIPEAIRASWTLADGHPINAEVHANPLMAGSSGLAGIVLVVRDLQESLEIDRLKSLDRMKDAFLSTVSHELRTPLASILSYAEALHDGIVDNEEERNEFLETIQAEGMRLSQLINDILDLSKIESGKMAFQFALVDVGHLLADSASAIRKLAKDKGQTLSIERDPAATSLFGDHARLVQVLVNFLSNAWKFTPEKGRISIGAIRRASGVELYVQDSGIGITKEDIPKVFQRFVQLGDQRDRPRGTGIGMAIAKEIVERHGSHIDIQSEPSLGSRFSFLIADRQE